MDNLLQNFFANIRQQCGPNTTPDPHTFAQLYRLLSVYSLLSPPKNSNVGGAANLNALMSADDPIGKANDEKREEFEAILDQVLSNGKLQWVKNKLVSQHHI